MKRLFPFLSGTVLLSCILLYAPRQAESCGPSFPNHILGTGKWRSAPYVDFERELTNLGLLPKLTNEERAMQLAPQTSDTDVRDLEEILGKREGESQGLIRSYRRVRYGIDTLAEHQNEQGEMETNEAHKSAEVLWMQIDELAKEGLPEEFKLYVRGALLWRQERSDEACKQWQALLELLPQERKSRSIWAAFMLGRANLHSNPDIAWKHFETVARLKSAGFRDSLNLGDAAMGWKGFIALSRKDYGSAIDCYLAQKGSNTSIDSLRITAAKALDEGSPAELKKLAANGKWRTVITAFLVSNGPRFMRAEDKDGSNRLGNWQSAIEAAEVQDAQLTERFALAAYQSGNMEEAKKWADLSSHAPVSQWILAKLALYNGDIEEAARILKPLSKKFPLQPEAASAGTLAETLVMTTGDWETFSAGQQVAAELGTVELSRKNFAEALDAFMLAGFWVDAAYVAERVLTVDELRNFIDQNSTRLEHIPTANLKLPHLKNLLARRLMRSGKASLAGTYFSEELQPEHSKLVQHLKAGYDPGLAREQRAVHLLEAAKLTRKFGMELMGTELEPDWAESAGAFEWGEFFEIRNELEEDKFLAASEVEMARGKESDLPFSRRFHYRYVAAELAWIAAGFMPDHHDETARMLCLGGSWLKYRDPNYADRFYKALVNRCRKTEMGAKADAMRWFPKVDEGGNMIVPPEKPVEEDQLTAESNEFVLPAPIILPEAATTAPNPFEPSIE